MLSLAGAAPSIIFVASKVLSRQTQNTSFVATKICLSWQNYCHDKIMFVVTNICHNKTFVATSILLSRQNTSFVFVTSNMCLSQQNFCRNKNYPCGSSRQWYYALTCSLRTSALKLQKTNIHTACTFPVATQLTGNKNWRCKLTWKQSYMLHWVVFSSIFINKNKKIGGGIGEERTRKLGSN